MSGGPPAGAAGSHVVIAELEGKPERLGAFVALARAFAAECLAREPGCRQFQVVRLESTPHHVLFFEAYDDAAAFDAHRASDHLVRFKAAFQDMVMGEQPLRQGQREQEWHLRLRQVRHALPQRGMASMGCQGAGRARRRGWRLLDAGLGVREGYA